MEERPRPPFHQNTMRLQLHHSKTCRTSCTDAPNLQMMRGVRNRLFLLPISLRNASLGSYDLVCRQFYSWESFLRCVQLQFCKCEETGMLSLPLIFNTKFFVEEPLLGGEGWKHRRRRWEGVKENIKQLSSEITKKCYKLRGCQMQYFTGFCHANNLVVCK